MMNTVDRAGSAADHVDLLKSAQNRFLDELFTALDEFIMAAVVGTQTCTQIELIAVISIISRSHCMLGRRLCVSVRAAAPIPPAIDESACSHHERSVD